MDFFGGTDVFAKQDADSDGIRVGLAATNPIAHLYADPLFKAGVAYMCLSEMINYAQEREPVRHHWIYIVMAGSLSVTQTTINRLAEAAEDLEAGPEVSIMAAPTMLGVADIIGNMLSDVTASVTAKMERQAQGATASMIVAGQRKGGDMRMFLIYP